MNFDDTRYLLGLHFFGNKFRIIEAEQAGHFRITKASETLFETPFDFYAIGNEDLVPQFAGAINNAVENKIIAQKSLVALERRMVIMKHLIVDKNISGTDLKQHIEWELEQLLISSRDEYNVGFERTANLGNEFASVTVVAVRKSIIQYLKNIFKATPLDLTRVDIDLFSAIKTLMYNYPEARSGLCAFVDLQDKGIDVVLTYDKQYLVSGEISDFSKDLSYSNAGHEEIAILVNDELLKLLNSLDSQSDELAPNSIFIAGKKAEAGIVPYLQNLQHESFISFVDPFHSVEKQLDTESTDVIKKNPDRFLSGLGLLLPELKGN